MSDDALAVTHHPSPTTHHGLLSFRFKTGTASGSYHCGSSRDACAA